MKIAYYIFLVFIFICSTLYARPDMRFDDNGDNKYGTSDNATGGEKTIYNAICGKYSNVKITLENDGGDNNSKEEVYQVSIVAPSNSWDYYIVYKNEKYTGDWATEWIDNSSPDYFDLYVKPPDGASAQTSTFKVIAEDVSGNTDAVSVYVNVIEKEVFDLVMLSNDNLTVGTYIYHDNDDKEQCYITVYPYYDYNITFKVKNRGNKTRDYKLVLKNNDYSSQAIRISNGSSDLTDSAYKGIVEYLANGSETSYNVRIIGKYIDKSGDFNLELYDVADNTLIDSFTVNISYISANHNFYEMPYFYMDDNSTAILFIVNESDKVGDVTIDNLSDNSSSSYSIEPKTVKMINLSTGSRLKLSSQDIFFAPFIIVFDSNFNITANLHPINVALVGKNIVLPILTQGTNLGTSLIYLSNLSNSTNNITLSIYSYNGEKVSDYEITLLGNSYSSISVDDLVGNDSTEVYWLEINGDYDISAYLVNNILNSYLKTYGFKLNQ